MTRLGETLLECARCGITHILGVMFRTDGGTHLCRQCINDLYNLEQAKQAQAEVVPTQAQS